MITGTFSGDGTSSAYVVPAHNNAGAVLLAPPLMVASVHGVWGGATVTLYQTIPGGTPLAIYNGVWTSDTHKSVTVVQGASYHLECSGSGSPIPALEYAFGA